MPFEKNPCGEAPYYHHPPEPAGVQPVPRAREPPDEEEGAHADAEGRARAADEDFELGLGFLLAGGREEVPCEAAEEVRGDVCEEGGEEEVGGWVEEEDEEAGGEFG